MRRLLWWPTLLACCCLLAGAAGAQTAQPASTAQAAQPAPLQASALALVVNDDEPDSVAIAELYRQAHGVPAANIAHVRIAGRPQRLSAAAFDKLKKEIDAQLPANVRAVLMVWTAPYAVECNSITAAYTNGFDADQCARSCGPGKASALFDAPAAAAAARLSMLMPIESVPLAKQLIARGASRSFQLPAATAYFLHTSDPARSSRAQFFPRSGVVPQKSLTVKTLRTDVLEGARDIMLYQTGLVRVAKLDTLQFLPGALADHLTSTGGDLLSDSQMSSLRWLEAGATASYGTVSEPCNYWQKFPHPTVLLKRYLSGLTALEAYWTSVAWPAQGLFIGDPLAAPYRR